MRAARHAMALPPSLCTCALALTHATARMSLCTAYGLGVQSNRLGVQSDRSGTGIWQAVDGVDVVDVHGEPGWSKRGGIGGFGGGELSHSRP